MASNTPSVFLTLDSIFNENISVIENKIEKDNEGVWKQNE